VEGEAKQGQQESSSDFAREEAADNAQRQGEVDVLSSAVEETSQESVADN